MITHRLTTRLAQLRQDLATGRERLTQLDAQRSQLTETLLRIAGAVQVLEELLREPEEEATLETAL
jgi:predicted nuclease with TOPRIM domain